jgi:hypothetical protein
MTLSIQVFAKNPKTRAKTPGRKGKNELNHGEHREHGGGKILSSEF